jgi:GNAT superfamily N-acetyltransferase
MTFLTETQPCDFEQENAAPAKGSASFLSTRIVGFAELRADCTLQVMLEEYADECSIEGMPRFELDIAHYLQAESTGALTFIGVFVGDVLAGYASVFFAKCPHYSALIGSTESLFVKTCYRNTGAGAALRKAIKVFAFSRKAVGVFTCAPKGGVLEKLLRCSEAVETNVVFFEPLS